MPLDKAPVENADLFPESLSLNAKRREAVAHKIRNTVIFAISDKSDQSIHASSANRSDDPDFGEMGSDRVRDRGQLADEQMPRSMQRQALAALEI
jgi:hypothetical protein